MKNSNNTLPQSDGKPRNESEAPTVIFEAILGWINENDYFPQDDRKDNANQLTAAIVNALSSLNGSTQ